jgi:hypothetical protein
MHSASKSFVIGTLLTIAACGGGSASTTGGTGGSSGTGAASTSSSASSSSSSSGISAMQACADQVKAVCKQRDTCSLNAFANDRTYGSEALCESLTAPPCVSALAAKGTGQSPANIENCVAAYSGVACPDFYDNNPPMACLPPAGTLATGAACGANAQCVSTYCAVTQFAVCGTCQPLPVAGAACTIQADCGRDLACATPTGATAGVCAAFVAMGGACLTGVAPCQAGFSCVGDDEVTKTMGTCKASGLTVGAACDGTRKTAPGCDNNFGLVCIPTAKGSAVGTCQAITLVAPGATCGAVGAMPITGFTACQAGGLCKKAAVTDPTGTCVAAVAPGTACDSDPTKGPTCTAPARCVPTAMGMTAGTCTVPDATKCM